MCEVCNGSAVLEQVGPETGHTFALSRHYNEDTGTYDNYFNVEELDTNGNVILQTFTPDVDYCPNCGIAL